MKKSFSTYLKDYMMLIVLVAVLVAFGILGPAIADRNFLAAQNLLNILSQNAYLVIIGVGITFIMLGGGMDLSTGYLLSTVGISMALVNTAFNNKLAEAAAQIQQADINALVSGSVDIPWGLSVFVNTATNTITTEVTAGANFTVFAVTFVCGVLLAILLSAFNGAMYAWLKIFPFIITLATQYILNGATYLLSGGMTRTYQGLSGGFKFLGGTNINLGIGNLKSGVIVMIIMVIIGSFILNKTYLGRNIYALGSNPDAVALSGVSVAKMRVIVFALAGLFFGIAQVVNIGRIGSVNNSMGMGAEFTVMAGAMLGGIKMGGGGGKMSNMVIGVLIIGVLNSGMNFLNINQYWQNVALGVVLLAAIILDTLQTNAAIKNAKKVSGSAPAAQ